MPSASLLVVVFVGTCPQSESFTGEFLLAKRSYRSVSQLLQGPSRGHPYLSAFSKGFIGTTSCLHPDRWG